MSATEENAFGNWAVESNPVLPDLVPSKVVRHIKKSYVTNFDIIDSYTKEEEYGSELSMNTSYKITDYIRLDLKVGGKYKHKNKKYDYDMIRLPNWGGRAQAREVMYNYLQPKFPQDFIDAGYDNPREGVNFPYAPFMDRDYDVSKFMGGQFSIGYVTDIGVMHDVIDEIAPEIIHDEMDTQQEYGHDIDQVHPNPDKIGSGCPGKVLLLQRMVIESSGQDT